MTPEVAKERAMAKMDIYIAVFNAHNTHFNSHDSAEAIARAYRNAGTSRHQQAASETGRMDELVAMKILNARKHL